MVTRKQEVLQTLLQKIIQDAEGDRRALLYLTELVTILLADEIDAEIDQAVSQKE